MVSYMGRIALRETIYDLILFTLARVDVCFTPQQVADGIAIGELRSDKNRQPRASESCVVAKHTPPEPLPPILTDEGDKLETFVDLLIIFIFADPNNQMHFLRNRISHRNHQSSTNN